MNYAELVARFSRMAEEKGMVNSLEGNLSMIDRSTGNIYITPSHKAKSLLTPEMICVVSPEGEQIGGTGRKSSEFFLHEALVCLNGNRRSAHPAENAPQYFQYLYENSR